MSKKLFTSILLLILFIFIGSVYIVPCIKPLEIKSVFTPYNYIVYSDHAEIEDYVGDEENVVVPKWLLGHKVTVIRPYAYTDNLTIKTVTIHNNIEKIQHGAFWGCENLQKVDFSEGLRVIENNAFAGCYELIKVELPNSVKEIGHHAFAYCDLLSDISIPTDIEKIEDGAFKETPWLENQKEEFVTAGTNILIKYNGENSVLNIPDGIAYLSQTFFHFNNNIIKIELPTSVKLIGMGCFWHCENLEYIIFNNPDTCLDEEAIMDCPKLTIVSPKNSTSHKYAEKNGIPWMELEE